MGADDTPTTTPTSTVEQMNHKPLEGEVVGANSEYSPTNVSKIISAFHNGYSVIEACQFIGIHRDTYYGWLERYPQFKEKIEEAKLMPNRVAKEIVVSSMSNAKKDPSAALSSAKWWLERRDPEFKNQVGVSAEPGLEKTRDKIKEFLDEPTDYDDPAGEPTAAEPDVAGTEPAESTAPASPDEVAPATPDIS